MKIFPIIVGVLLACGPAASAQPKKFKLPDVVSSIAISGDGKIVLTGSIDGTATLWDAASGRRLRTLEGHANSVSAVALSGDGKFALTISAGKSVILWDASNGAKLHSFDGHKDKITSVALSGDGKLALTGSDDKTAILWDAATGKQLHLLEGHTNKVTGVALSADGKLALTGSLDETAALWGADGKKIRTLTSVGRKSRILGVALSGDGKFALANGVNYRNFWDTTTGKVLHNFPAGAGNIALSGDGKRALMIGLGVTGIWDTENAKIAVPLDKSDDPKQTFHRFALSRDGKVALSSSFDRKPAVLWDATTGKRTQLFPGPNASPPPNPFRIVFRSHSAIHSLALSEDNRTLLVGHGWGASVWDLAQAKRSHVLVRKYNPSFGSAVSSAALSGDGKLAITTDDNDATLWDAITGKKLFDLKGDDGYVRAVALSGSNITARTKTNWALTGSAYGTAILWDAATGKQIKTFKGKRFDPILRVALHDDFSLLTGSLQGGAVLWGISSGGAMKGFRHSNGINGLAQGFDNKNAFVISAGDKRAVMWSKIDGKVIRTYPHQVNVTCLQLSADLKHLVTGDLAGLAHLWDTRSAKEIQSFHHGELVKFAGDKQERMVLRQGDDVTAVALTSDGKHLWTSTSFGSIRLWDVKTGKELCRLYEAIGDSPHWLVATPDGRFDGPPAAWKEISYRELATGTLREDDDFRRKFHHPGLLAKILHGKN